MRASLPSLGCPGATDRFHLCEVNGGFETLWVPAEPDVSEGSCSIWPGSLCAAIYSPSSLTGVDLGGGERWWLSVTLPGEGQGEQLWDKAGHSCFPDSWWRPNSVFLLESC